MLTNKNLHRAKCEKNDEFYTQYEDIEKEMVHYTPHFKDKVIYCNCDSEKSNFYKFFKDHFEEYQLKRLLCTHYNPNDSPYAIVIDRDKNEEYRLLLNGDGGFHSPECMNYLAQADIVVTNPPFSLFREYVAQLEEFGKKYLIIGSMNAITYKEIFPLIKENRLWLGINHINEFIKPNGGIRKFGNINWYSNLDHNKRHESLSLYKQYHSEEYHKYDNYDAINIDKTADIPKDYQGVIGVPISYLDHHNPNDFDIIKFRKGDDEKDLRVNGEDKYFRILIRRKR